MWPVRRASPSLFVPASTVVETPEARFVERVRSERIHVSVQRGAAMGNMVEVFGALKPGDEVVAQGSEDLVDGVTVAVRIAHR